MTGRNLSPGPSLRTPQHGSGGLPPAPGAAGADTRSDGWCRDAPPHVGDGYHPAAVRSPTPGPAQSQEGGARGGRPGRLLGPSSPRAARERCNTPPRLRAGRSATQTMRVCGAPCAARDLPPVIRDLGATRGAREGPEERRSFSRALISALFRRPRGSRLRFGGRPRTRVVQPAARRSPADTVTCGGTGRARRRRNTVEACTTVRRVGAGERLRPVISCKVDQLDDPGR